MPATQLSDLRAAACFRTSRGWWGSHRARSAVSWSRGWRDSCTPNEPPSFQTRPSRQGSYASSSSSPSPPPTDHAWWLGGASFVSRVVSTPPAAEVSSQSSSASCKGSSWCFDNSRSDRPARGGSAAARRSRRKRPRRAAGPDNARTECRSKLTARNCWPPTNSREQGKFHPHY